MRGRELRYAYANDAYYGGFPGREFLGNTAFGVMVELEDQPFFGLLQRVFDSGEPLSGEAPILLKEHSVDDLVERRVQFSYSPIRDAKGAITEIIAEGRLLAPVATVHGAVSDRAAQVGIRSLNDEELLYLFLGERGDDAAELILRHKDLCGVFAAGGTGVDRPNRSSPALRNGLRPAALTKLKVAGEVQRRLLLGRLKNRTILKSDSLLSAYLRRSLAAEPREQFCVLFLDHSLCLIADEVMWTGTSNHAPVYPREICRRAIELSASSFVMAHNHPSGGRDFSSQDYAITREVISAARTLGLILHDHYLVASEKVISMRRQARWPWD